MGGKTQRSYRLDADVVNALEAWAAEHGTTNTEAVETLLRAAMDARGQAGGDQETIDALKANLGDLRAQVATLTEQVAAKDEQIRGLMDLADHAQQLHAATVQGLLADGGEAAGDGETGGGDVDDPQAVEAAQEPQERPAGLWERIKAALMGY